MKRLIESLQVFQELEQERRDLEKLGLSDEEINGCIEFFIDNYFKVEDTKPEVLN